MNANRQAVLNSMEPTSFSIDLDGSISSRDTFKTRNEVHPIYKVHRTFCNVKMIATQKLDTLILYLEVVTIGTCSIAPILLT